MSFGTVRAVCVELSMFNWKVSYSRKWTKSTGSVGARGKAYGGTSILVV